MTDQEILEKAIKKAIDGGWKPEYKLEVVEPLAIVAAGPYGKFAMGCFTIIFNHEFAKSLWGEEALSPNYGDMEMLGEPDYAWEHHLQHMVIAEDPIKYLGDNI